MKTGVGRPHFHLAFDMQAYGFPGHFLVYREIGLDEWLSAIAPCCSTVYVHSINGINDTHDPSYTGKLQPGQMALPRPWLPEETRLIAKLFGKAALSESVAWIEAALGAGQE